MFHIADPRFRVPLLSFLFTNPWEESRDYTEGVNHCQRLLLAAEADPSLCNPQADYEGCSFLLSVASMHIVRPNLINNIGNICLDTSLGYTATVFGSRRCST